MTRADLNCNNHGYKSKQYCFMGNKWELRMHGYSGANSRSFMAGCNRVSLEGSSEVYFVNLYEHNNI